MVINQKQKDVHGAMVEKFRIIIIAGGESVKDIPADELVNYGHVIGVNESAYLFNCHTAISMDRLWMEARYKELEKKNCITYFRKCAWKKGYIWPRLRLFDGDIHSKHMSMEDGVLAGKNSGDCACNLAYKMKPDEIYLFGFDMRGGYFYDQTELTKIKEENEGKKIKINQSDSKYKAWIEKFNNNAKQFKEAGIDVYNVSPSSALTCFKRIGYGEFRNKVSR